MQSITQARRQCTAAPPRVSCHCPKMVTMGCDLWPPPPRSTGGTQRTVAALRLLRLPLRLQGHGAVDLEVLHLRLQDHGAVDLEVLHLLGGQGCSRLQGRRDDHAFQPRIAHVGAGGQLVVAALLELGQRVAAVQPQVRLEGARRVARVGAAGASGRCEGEGRERREMRWREYVRSMQS